MGSPVSFINYPIEIFTVLWNSAFAGLDDEEALEAAGALLTEQPDLSVSWRESSELSIDERSMPLEVLDVETEGLYFTALIGVWMCDASEQAFVLTFATDASGTSEVLIARFGELLETFACKDAG